MIIRCCMYFGDPKLRYTHGSWGVIIHQPRPRPMIGWWIHGGCSTGLCFLVCPSLGHYIFIVSRTWTTSRLRRSPCFGNVDHPWHQEPEKGKGWSKYGLCPLKRKILGIYCTFSTGSNHACNSLAKCSIVSDYFGSIDMHSMLNITRATTKSWMVISS